MKKLIFVIIFGVAGYFAYQYFIGPSKYFSTTARPTFNMQSLPEKCQKSGESMKNSFYLQQKGEIVKAQVNGFTVNFRRCLRRAGFTTSQIDEAYEGIADSAGYSSW